MAIKHCEICWGDNPEDPQAIQPCTCPDGYDDSSRESYDYIQEECHDPNDHDVWEWALSESDLDAYEWNEDSQE